jgi:hypothetical protein
MMEQIKIFLFVLSIIYTLRFIFEFIMKLTQENPEPLVIKEVEKVFLYFSSAYIITYFLI